MVKLLDVEEYYVIIGDNLIISKKRNIEEATKVYIECVHSLKDRGYEIK